MFLEIKPYQYIKLEEVIGFAMYPGGAYEGKILYVHLRGAERDLQFSFDSERDCKYAYFRLKHNLWKLGNKMEEFRDEQYIQ